MMLQLGDDIASRPGYEHEQVTMFHDHNEPYDGALQRIFWRMKKDVSFKHGHHFKSLVSGEWKDYVPLQAADFVVYENRRNIPNHMEERELGPQLNAMLKLPNFGGGSFIVRRVDLKQIRERLGREWLSEI